MDEIDKKLVSALKKDGRASLSAIGKELGLSHVAIGRRLDRLVKSGIIQVSAGVRTDFLDMKIAFVGLETESKDVEHRIMRKYANCPRLLVLAPVTGRYNLFAMIVADDSWTLDSMIGTCSMRTEPGVRRSECWFGNAPLIPEFLFIDLVPQNSKGLKSPCDMNCNVCKRYQVDKCVGCPSTSAYRGVIWALAKLKKPRSRTSKV